MTLLRYLFVEYVTALKGRNLSSESFIVCHGTGVHIRTVHRNWFVTRLFFKVANAPSIAPRYICIFDENMADNQYSKIFVFDYFDIP